jgi:hypothetical protein
MRWRIDRGHSGRTVSDVLEGAAELAVSVVDQQVSQYVA